MHINCRSLDNSYNEILGIIKLKNLDIDVIALTETWLSDNTCTLYPISSYNAFFKNRINQAYGGIAVYEKDAYTCVTLQDYSNHLIEPFESTFLEITNVPLVNKTILGCIYRPPRSILNEFVAKIDNLLSQANKQKPTCLLGDFNIDLFKSENN